jgi:hypothetical protein
MCHTALELADVEESNLTKELAHRALAYVNRPRAEQPQLSEVELEKIRQAVLTAMDAFKAQWLGQR